MWIKSVKISYMEELNENIIQTSVNHNDDMHQNGFKFP
jgi:hypothetical protein